MLPLHRLFSALQAAGLFIGPAERLRVQQVLADNPAAWQTAEGRAALMYELAPLFCRNRTEQEVFYKTYQAFLGELTEPIEIKDDEVKDKKPAFWKKYGKILFGILALVAALFAAWWWMQHRTVEENVTIDFRIKPGQVFGGKLAPGDTLFLINQSSVKDTANYDFTWLVYEWREENGPIFLDTAFETRYILPELLDHKKYERFRIQLQAMHRQTRQLHTGRAREITVVQPCPKPIQVKDSIRVAGQVKTGSHIQIFAPKDAPKHCEFEWSFEDQADFSDTTIYTRNPVYKIKKAGTLTLRLQLTDTTQAGYCDTTLTKEIFIQEDIPTLAALPLYKDEVKPIWAYTWLSIAIALLAFALAVWFAWRWWRRPSIIIPPPAPNIPESLRRAFETEPADKTPYSIPHRSNNSQIRLAAEQIELANTFRRRQEGQVAMLNIPRSIQATMEKLGYAELRFSFNTRPTHYLFLIDLQNEVSHQAQLFRYLVEMLEGQDVLADVFFYKNSLSRCWNKRHPEGLTLEQLALQYADRRLVVFGDGYRLLTEANEGEALHKEQAEALRHWPQRMLLTPAPVAAWTYREARLYQLWAVFHADLGGLMQAARFVEAGMDDENLPPTFAEWKRQCQRSAIDADTDRDWDTPAEHRDYLREADDRDGALYRWLRALSVYPELNWNVTIAIGRALGIEVRYEHLLVLARIPWLQSGAMKPALWRAWMREMPLPDAAPDETLARSAVLAELRAVEALCAEGYADQKMQTRLAVQHFALAPSDRDAQDRLYYILQHIAPAPLLTEELDRTVQRNIPEFQWTDQKPGRALAYLRAGQPQPSVQRPFWTSHIIWCMLCWPFFLLPLLVAPERWAGLYERYPTATELFVAPQEDEAVRLNNLAVEEMYNDSAVHSYKFIQLEVIPGSRLLWSGDDSYPVFRMLSDAIFLRNGAYPLAETNRAKILFNSGLQFLDVKLLRVKDPEKDAQENRIRGIALLQLSVQNDSLRLPAAEALAVAYYQNQQPDSACYWMNKVLALKPDARNWLAEKGVCIENPITEYRFNATVVDAATGRGLPDATLRPQMPEVKVSNNRSAGSFLLTLRAPGPAPALRVLASCAGYVDSSFVLQAGEGINTLRLRLATAPARSYVIYGRVLTEGQPLSNVTVTTNYGVTQTGADGRYRLSLPPANTYPSQFNLVFTKAGYENAEANVGVAQSVFPAANPIDMDVPNITMRLLPPADRDRDGTPDASDGCPDDPAKTAPGACGCGKPDSDTDGDGIADCNDRCPDEKGIKEYNGCPSLSAKKLTDVNLKAHAINSVTGDTLYGVEFKLYQIDGPFIEKFLNEPIQEYRTKLERESRYWLVGSKDDYSKDSILISTKQLPNGPNLLVKEIRLMPLDISNYLPIVLYFDNDEPDKSVLSNTTNREYRSTYLEFMRRKEDYKSGYTKGLSGVEVIKATDEMELFFNRNVRGGYQQLMLFSEALYSILENGDTVHLSLKGYSSPRGATGYNLSLSSRRIYSVFNHFLVFDGGTYKSYIDSGQLTFDLEPFGETKSPKGISDMINDERNSVYSIPAMSENRVEIVGFKIRKK